MTEEKKKFSPLVFLASLGAGGIAVTPFAFLQYTHEHGPGLVRFSDIMHGSIPFLHEAFFYGLEAIMVVFTLLHLVLTVVFARQLVAWMRTEGFRETLSNPLTNTGLLAPFISITMTMNVFIGPIRYFIPSFAENLQTFMLPALVFWLVLWAALMYMEVSLLKISFSRGFDTAKISFGWLLHPFALGMMTVVGMGIAAMAHDRGVADTAVFFSLVSGSMGLFLLLVKLVVIFKSHFSAAELPDKQFLPSFLIVIPNVTLYAISAFRFGHYLEHAHGFHTEWFSWMAIVVSFAFEVWYMLFGLALLSDYFKRHFFRKEFYVTQWGLVCPVVAFAVLGSFTYFLFLDSPFMYAVIVATMLVSVALFATLFARHFRCARARESARFHCR
jgi:hypothetical protein